MEIHVTEQVLVFLWMTAAGVCASAVYDMFRILRKLFRMPDWAVFICDAVFWIACTVITFTGVMYSNHGELRWFVFAGLAIGGAVYFSLLSCIITKTILFMLKIIVRILMFFRKILLLTGKLFSKPKRFIKTKAGRFKKYLKHIAGKPKSGLMIIKKARKNNKNTRKINFFKKI